MVHMYLAFDKLRQSIGVEMTQSSNKDATITMPYMPDVDKGRILKFTACKDQYKSHSDKASKPIQGFLRLLASAK
eukprot:10474395-Karenia_brevis.AAC.1